jgi:hypothetical protein
MSKQTFGIGGPWTGQVGKTYVGGIWKGIPYFRKYVIPANPKTTDQVAQRGKFKICQVIASSILQTIIWLFWDPFAVKESGFNRFIGLNSQRVADNQDFLNSLIASGGYEQIAGITTLTYDTATGQVHIEWDVTVYNIGSPDDLVHLVVVDKTDYDPDQKTPILLSYVATPLKRSLNDTDITIRTGLTAANIFAYLFCTQPATEKILKVSNSISQVCVAL